MPPPTPSVSIVIAAHNEGASVRRTVESIVANTSAPDFEIMLVDDGSTDGSFDFLDTDSFQGNGHLRRFRFDQSAGCIRARHQGARMARGEHIAFLDGHMPVAPGWLAVLVEAVQRHGAETAVVPAITGLNEADWSLGSPTGQVVAVDEQLGFVWKSADDFPEIVPTVGGCCMLTLLRFYFQAGGFDFGLRRWAPSSPT